jgi:VWFA-related protein
MKYSLYMRQPVSAASAAYVLACLLTSAPHLRAQESPGPLIRSETRTVLVDAVAIDKKGKFATDLAQKNFRIWEDGKEQKPTGFSLESAGVSPERPARHYIAMFFDTSTAAQASQMVVRQQALRFVDGFASPDRYMAVINYNVDSGIHIAQNFTTDRDLLKKALNTTPASPGFTPAPANTPRPARGGRGGNPAGAVNTASDTFAYRSMLQSLRSVVASLANIRGRKALVFFSGGIPVTGDLLSDLDATVDACNKANVAVYTVGPGPVGNSAADTGGLAGASVGRASRGVQMPELSMDAQSTPGTLSEGTGGILFSTTNDLAASLGKIAREQDQYYLLSYTPTVNSAEGSCHELKVKVDRSDLEVRARKSYCTSKPADLLSGKPAGTALEARAASAAPGNITAKMQLPWFYTAPNVARVNVAMEIIPSAMKFQKEKNGKLHGEFDLAGVAYKADGTAAARVSDIVKLDFDTQQQVDAFLQSPYHYENQFEVAPGQYNFRMAFTSGGADARGFGKLEIPLIVDPWNGQSLAISGIALSHDAHPAADLAAGLDVSLLEGERPLTAKGAEAIPTGASQFHAGDPAYFYFEAYEPLLATAKPDAPLPLIGIRIRVLDRATSQQKSDTGARSAATYERAGNATVPVISSLPIANLSAGAYKLEVSVMRESGVPVIRTSDFDIN